MICINLGRNYGGDCTESTEHRNIAFARVSADISHVCRTSDAESIFTKFIQNKWNKMSKEK